MEFNRVYEYPLVTFFVWNITSITGVLTLLQLELVEYKMITVYFVSTVNSHIEI